MALMRRSSLARRNQPEDWVAILTADPVRRKRWVTDASIMGVTLFVTSLMFTLAVIIVQPVLLMYHSTLYPNLATLAFTSLILPTVWLTVVTYRFWVAGRYQPNKQVKDTFVAVFLSITAVFLWLLFWSILQWSLIPVGFQRVLDSLSSLIP